MVDYDELNRRPDAKKMTCWTQKGRMMIHNILTF